MTEPTVPAQAGDAQIVDRGYRSYDGPRLGVAGAVRSLGVASIQRALGLRRPFRYKIVPIITVVIAYLPAAAFFGIAALIPDQLIEAVESEGDTITPDYAGYYGFITAAIALFLAFAGPELLCTDRRTGMLGMYLAAPLDRVTYLATKLVSIVTVLLLVTLGPPLLLLLGYVFLDIGPDGVLGFLGTFLRIVASGLAIALFLSVLAMVVSSMTDRSGFAGAGIIASLFGSAIFAGVLTEVADAPAEFEVINLFGLPFEVAFRIFGEVSEENFATVSTPVVLGAYLGFMAIGLAFVWWRYQNVEVTR